MPDKINLECVQANEARAAAAVTTTTKSEAFESHSEESARPIDGQQRTSENEVSARIDSSEQCVDDSVLSSTGLKRVSNKTNYL